MSHLKGLTTWAQWSCERHYLAERIPSLQIRGVGGNDDFAAMEEVLYQRFGNLLAEGRPQVKLPEDSRIRPSW